jgi:uncharacterized membrane protein YqjE
MSNQELRPPGIVESLRRLCDNGLALLETRAELFAVEVQEQKAHLGRTLLLAVVALFLTNTALLVLTGTIVFLVGESARVPVLIALSLLYIAAAVVAFLLLRNELRSTPPPFSGTVSELRKDREWLRQRK